MKKYAAYAPHVVYFKCTYLVYEYKYSRYLTHTLNVHHRCLILKDNSHNNIVLYVILVISPIYVVTDFAHCFKLLFVINVHT